MQPDIFPAIRAQVRAILNGYLDAPELEYTLAEFIVPSALSGRAGVMGALALASQDGAL